MKTWKMIKELTEHPSKEFKNEYGSIIHHNGLELRWKDDRSRVDFTNKFINGKWKEIKQPVTWQEALEAWGNGKDVTLVTDGKEYSIEFDDLALEREDIKEGEWFINE